MLNLILLFAMPVAFGLNTVIGRGMTGLFAPAQLTVVRWLLAGLAILLIALARRGSEGWRPAPAGWLEVLGVGAVGMGFCSYCAYAGSQLTAATNVSLFYACTSALVVTYEWVTRQTRATPLLVAGVGLSIIGAAVIVTKGHLEQIATIALNTGDLWGIAGMLGWTGYTIALKHLRHGLTPFAMFAVTALAGAVAFLPVAVLETPSYGLPKLTPVAVAWIAAMVLIASVGSYMLYSFALRRAGPILTSAALTLNPVYAAILATLLVGEQLAWYHALGGALVLSGLGLINWDKARSTRQAG